MPNNPPPAWLGALPSLFAIGAKMGGAPTVGTAALQGAHNANVLAEQSQQLDFQNRLRQQDMDLRTQQLAAQTAAQELARQEAAEQRRQAAIRSSVDDLRQQRWPNKAAYDASVTAHETMLQNGFGVRPNTLRTLVPYNGPTAESRANEVLEKLTKQENWRDIVAGNGIVMFDRDEDGVPERVPVSQLVELAKFPIARDPVSGDPMLPPKEVKTDNLQQFDVTFQGVLGEYKAEGKDINDPVVRGKASQEALRRNAQASKSGNISVTVPPPPERPMTRYQRFTAEKGLRDDVAKLLEPIRDMNRQVTVMRAGLDQIERTGRLDAGTQAVINTFNRIMEPGSVTREAEYLRSTLGQPVFEALAGKWRSLTAGGPGVTKETLRLIVDLAEDIAGRLGGSVDEPLRMISEQATEFQIPVDRVVPARESFQLRPRGGQRSVNSQPGGANAGDLRERARQKLKEAGYATTDANVDKFLADPRNKALLTGGQ